MNPEDWPGGNNCKTMLMFHFYEHGICHFKRCRIQNKLAIFLFKIPPFVLVINFKMPTIVCILKFMIRTNGVVVGNSCWHFIIYDQNTFFYSDLSWHRIKIRKKPFGARSSCDDAKQHRCLRMRQNIFTCKITMKI